VCSQINIDQTSGKPSEVCRETDRLHLPEEVVSLQSSPQQHECTDEPQMQDYLLMLIAETMMMHAEGHGVEVGCDYAKVADMLRKKLGNNGSAVAP